MGIKVDVFLHLCMCTVPLRCVWLLPWIDPVGIGSALRVLFVQTGNQLTTHVGSGNFPPAFFFRIPIREMIRHREPELHASLPLAGQTGSSSTGTSVSSPLSFLPLHPSPLIPLALFFLFHSLVTVDFLLVKLSFIVCTLYSIGHCQWCIISHS